MRFRACVENGGYSNRKVRVEFGIAEHYISGFSRLGPIEARLFLGIHRAP